jgi:hypothetical protein
MTHLEAYHLALDLVKKAGFKLHQASMQSEACYYYHPAREPLLLRVATHSSKRGAMGLTGVVAKVTYSPKDKHDLSEAHVRNLLAIAIGRYFMTDPKPSRYYGKRGTWEDNENPQPYSAQ